jgi:hypothetical protein
MTIWGAVPSSTVKLRAMNQLGSRDTSRWALGIGSWKQTKNIVKSFAFWDVMSCILL